MRWRRRPIGAAHADPWSVGLEQIRRQVRLRRLLPVEHTRELPRSRCSYIVVGWLSNLVRAQCDAPDHVGQALEQLYRRRIRLTTGRRPVGHEPKISLQNRALEWLVNERFAVRSDQLIERGACL